MQIRTKHSEKTRVGLWRQLTILKAVWDYTQPPSNERQFDQEGSDSNHCLVLRGKQGLDFVIITLYHISNHLTQFSILGKLLKIQT